MRFALALATALLITLTTPLLAAWRAEGPWLGTVVDVASDPANPNVLYAATSSGGVWRSDDGGQHWILPGDDLVSRPLVWIAVDPGTPSTLWAGIDNPGHAGLWRSLDHGKSWNPVRPEKASYILDQPLAFAASNPSIIYAPSTNLHYRSADGGKTWESFRVPDQDAYAFAIDPKNPKIVYAGGRGTQHHLRRSTDGGKTWKPADNGLPDRSIKLLAIPRERPETIYAVASNQLFRSTNAGESWSELDLGLQGTEKLFSLDLDPHDPSTLFAGTENGLRRSTDGGETWTTVGGGLDNWYCKGVAFHPKTKGVVYAGTTGKGFFRSTDGGETFQPMSTGLGAGWTEKLWASPGAAAPLFAQLGVGLFREDAPGTWTELEAPFASGDKTEIDGIVFDRQSPKRLYAHQNAKWWRSEDAGRSWQQIEVPEPGMRDMMRGKIQGPEFDGLAQDAGDPKIFYAGGSWSKDMGGAPINRSTNGGKKWEAAGSGITGSVRMLRSPAPGVVIAVTGKDVYRSSDGAKTFTLVRSGEIKDLAADATHIYVATKQGLYRSSDSGATWSRAPGIKEDEVEAVALAANGKVFCGTFDGVFMSADEGSTWTALNEGLMNTDVRALAIGGSRLYAGFAGGSVQSMELP